MSSYDHANTSLKSVKNATIAFFFSFGNSFATFTGRGLSVVPRSTSYSWDAFTLWDIVISFSKDSCAWRSSQIAAWSGSSGPGVVIYGSTAAVISTSNSGTIRGCSSRYRSTSSSGKPSNMLMLSAYNGVASLLVITRGCVATRTFVFPHRNVMMFFCQFCLIWAVRSHGRPSSRGYAPCTLL